MLASTEPNAILITNGDNDTYPGWILTRIIHYRSDVKIVNRSLLNTDWYPRLITKEGVPAFITQAGLDSLTRETTADREKVRDSVMHAGDVILLGDRLIVRIIDAARRAGRPVYFACTVERNAVTEPYVEQGRPLGLVTLVTPARLPYPTQLRALLTGWVNDFRTGGLDSWHLRSASKTNAGRMLMRNYGYALHSLRDGIAAASPELRVSLFRWQQAHLTDLVPEDVVDELNHMWCASGGAPEIQEWCRRIGLER
jgi:hypothetical protein